MILHRPDGQYHPMRQSDCLRWLFFSESTGYRQVSAHCLSYARLLYPYFPDSRPTAHVSPLPGYGFLRPTDWLPAILQAYPSPIPHSPLSSRCGLPRRMYSLSRFLAPVRHLPSKLPSRTSQEHGGTKKTLSSLTVSELRLQSASQRLPTDTPFLAPARSFPFPSKL